MTESQRVEAKQYNWQQLRCDLLDRVLDLAFLLVAALVLARPLDQWLQHTAGLDGRWGRLAVLYMLVTLLHFVVSFGLSFYSGFVLEHRFGLSQQSLGRWGQQYLKRVALTVVFGLFVTLGLYAIIWACGRWWWIVAAGAFFLVSVILGQLFPVFIMPLFQKTTRLDDDSLMQRFRALAQGTGLTIEGVYRQDVSGDTVKANAQLAGLGRTRRVILDDTLLSNFTEDEIEVIFAHEVGHHVHKHMSKMVAMGVMYSAGIFLASDVIFRQYIRSVEGTFSYVDFPVWALPLFTLVFTGFSMLLEPLQNAISRHFERQSDQYALNCTAKFAAFRSAFHRLAVLNKAHTEPHWLEVALFHSHPPISQRLELAERPVGSASA
ncbi:MAG: M48 family metallopeptidase [Planctomycetales bacterium]|nr:M48 family metallopeptidase [Planctomycetales bacterium]